MSLDADNEQLLDAAEKLFYERGYQAVGMDALRSESGLSLKRIYAQYPGKDAIAVAMLDRRDRRWRGQLEGFVNSQADPARRPRAIFDWLSDWLSVEGYRGCAWINAYGELGANSPAVADAVRRHKQHLRDFIDRIVADAGGSSATGAAIFLLLEGCLVTSGITGNTEAVEHARNAAALMLEGDW